MDVVVDHRAPADHGPGAHDRALADTGLVADHRVALHARPREHHGSRAHPYTRTEHERLGRLVGVRAADRRLAEDRVVLDDAAVTEHDAIVDHDVRAEAHVPPHRGGRAEDQAGRVHRGWETRPARGGRRSLAYPCAVAPPTLTGAVLGLGMIGRHHARLLQTMAGVRFAGAADPAGDRFGAVRDPALVHASLDALLAAAPDLDFAVVAVPTDEHLDAVRSLAAAGVHVLVEKPLAATMEGARELIDVVRDAGVHAAVGHVERFNPALIELRRRVRDGQLGEPFLVATERLGPFPDRVRDIGVVKDLGTHDLDLVAWLAGAPIESIAAQTAHRMGRAHEDLVVASGRVHGGIVFSMTVDWLTPTKTRRTRILGERGMLLADTLTADLTFFANGDVASEWGATQALKGVSEGDVTRYALARREPLLVELEGFLALLRGEPEPAVVTLEEGMTTVACAEAVLASAAAGETVAPLVA